MTKTKIGLEKWRELYTLAKQVKELAPWEWMYENDLFGVQHPQTKEIGFVSVMGRSGEYFSIAVYLGAKALNNFWLFQELGPLGTPEMLMETRQLQASFLGRDDMEKEDLAIIKQLNLKFRGQHNWPQFRSHQPGYLPWFLEPDEVQFLRYILEQLLDVTPRFKANPKLFDMPDDDSYLVRVAMPQNGNLCWEDRILKAPELEDQEIPIGMNIEHLEAVKNAPKSLKKVETDFFMMPTPIMEGDRPFFPYVLLVVEPKSDMILGTEILAPHPSLEAMWGMVPAALVEQFAKLGQCPQEILVPTDFFFQLLEPVTDALDVKLRKSKRLKGLDAAKESLFQHFLGEAFSDDEMM